MKKILIIGASGMIGNSILAFLLKKNNYSIFATIRSSNTFKAPKSSSEYHLFKNIDAENKKSLERVFNKVNPDIVINCVGIVKQSKEMKNIYKVIYLNSLLPHYLQNLCKSHSSRFINIGTDCVFSGLKGNYSEKDLPDATDLYGRSKYLGETSSRNTITLRTSLIGHEYKNAYGLLEWFLSQNKVVEGYKKAIFSGLTVIEFANIVNEYVIPNNKLMGLYHISADPISKYDLLLLIKKIYSKNIIIVPENKKMAIDHSINSFSFRKATGFMPKTWQLMIEEMFDFRKNEYEKIKR
tara:strand:+ start:393 stop:1280 length:888 start_codon:yes stop_codon:yes gene_type:complete